MTVLLRSRSIMRGVFHHNHNHNHKKGQPNAQHAPLPSSVTIHHSPSTVTFADWESDSDEEKNVDQLELIGGGDDWEHIDKQQTELEYRRREQVAALHGLAYDEESGVKSILQALTPHEFKFLADVNMPLRHYRAEKGNLEEAIRKIKCTLKWREEFAVEDIKRCFDEKYISTLSSERQNELRELGRVIANENETGKIYCRGYDRQGRAILYLTPGKENSTHEMNNMRHLVYHLERAIACTKRKSGREKVCIVIGYQGFKLTNAPPMSTVKHTLMILQGHYPERMHRAYICDPPFVFRTFWKIIKHFVDPNTLEKIAFCDGKEGMAQLERDFDTIGTEKHAGGTQSSKLQSFTSTKFLYDTPFEQTYDESGWQSLVGEGS